MTYSDANIEFDKMSPASKARIIHIFEALCRENNLNVFDAFVAAVEDECIVIQAVVELGKTEGAMQ